MATVFHANRFTLNSLICSQIGFGDPSTIFGGIIGDQIGRFTCIEFVGALVAKSLESCGQVRLDELFARFPRGQVRLGEGFDRGWEVSEAVGFGEILGDFCAGFRFFTTEKFGVERCSHHGMERKAFAGELLGRLHQLAPTEFAKFLVSQSQSANSAWDT